MSELRALARGVPGAEWRRIIDVADPAAGVTPTIPVEAKRAWRVLSLSTFFAASGAAGNRVVKLDHVGPDGNLLGGYPAGLTLAATGAAQITWAAGLGTVVTAAGSETAAPIPAPLYVMPGESFSLAGIIDAGDRWSFTRLIVVETYTGDVVHERAMEQSIVDHFDAIHELITYGRP